MPRPRLPVNLSTWTRHEQKPRQKWSRGQKQEDWSNRQMRSGRQRYWGSWRIWVSWEDWEKTSGESWWPWRNWLALLKSTYLSHRLLLLTPNIPISLASSLHRWWASGVFCGRYRTHCFLVKGRRLIRFIFLLEGGFVGDKKVLVQFLCCCCSMAATRSASRWWARYL